MLTFARKSWDYFQIMLSPYVIHEATSPGMPKTLFPWGLAFSVKKDLLSYISRGILFLCSLHMVNIFRGHVNYAPNICYVLFFFSPCSEVSSYHHISILCLVFTFWCCFFLFINTRVIEFFHLQWCRKYKMATVLWRICKLKRAFIKNPRRQNSGVPLKGNLKTHTTQIGNKGERREDRLCKHT